MQLVPAEPLGVGQPGLQGPADPHAYVAALRAAAASASQAGATPGQAAAVAAACAEEEARLDVAVASSGDGGGCSGWWLTEAQAALVQRFQPGLSQEQEDTIGFFVAKFVRRRCSSSSSSSSSEEGQCD
jgi:hypothetical protein